MTNLIDASAKGVYPISVTPFTDDGRIDLASMDRLTDFFIDLKVPGVTLLGVMGEATKLSEDESLDLVRHVARRADGRFKIIAGVNQAGLDGFARFTRQVMDAGASGIMVAPAASLRTEEQIIASFEGIFSRIDDGVPVALQDFPQTTSVFMSVATLDTLIRRFPGIAIVKHEENSALRKISRLRAQEDAGGRRRVSVLVGNSGIHLPQELARGADGANTGVAFPEMLIEVCNRYFAGNAEAGEDLYDVFLPIIRHEQQLGVGLAYRKEIFRRRGLISSARLRAPGPAMDATDHAELGSLLARLERRLKDAGEAHIITSYRIGSAAA